MVEIKQEKKTSSRLCLVLKGPTIKEAREQIRAHLAECGMLELRLDLWSKWSLQDLQELRQEVSLPVIYTLRRERESQDSLEAYLQLISLRPDYLDVDSSYSESLLDQLQRRALSFDPLVVMLHSYHQMDGMPKDLEGLYAMLCKRCKPSDYIKIAVTPQSSLEALQFLEWVKEVNRGKGRLIGVAMGEYGAITRIQAACAGVPWSYTFPDTEEAVAPGQISCRIMQERYRFDSIETLTPFYGLLGDPVSFSISHWSHNDLFQRLMLEARYVKMRTTPEELEGLLDLAKQCGFLGFSVTHPLKEQIIPYLDRIDPQARAIGAVNTLCLEEGEWIGYNTDGLGALHALRAGIYERDRRKQGVSEDVFVGKIAIILGSGGCARAISHVLSQQGCHVKILSRNADTGQQLAKEVGGEYLDWGYLEKLATRYCDFLIQATPLDLEIDLQQLDSSWIVMETKTLPKVSKLVRTALSRGCFVVYGHAMFEEQALGQIRLWFPKNRFLQLSEADSFIQLIAQWRGKITKVISGSAESAFLK